MHIRCDWDNGSTKDCWQMQSSSHAHTELATVLVWHLVKYEDESIWIKNEIDNDRKVLVYSPCIN